MDLLTPHFAPLPTYRGDPAAYAKDLNVQLVQWMKAVRNDLERSGFTSTGDLTDVHYYHDATVQALVPKASAGPANWFDLSVDTLAGVPADARAVAMRVSFTPTAVGDVIRFRADGNSDIYNRTEVNGLVVDEKHGHDVVVPCTNGDIEYAISAVDWTLAPNGIEIAVKGWWM